jgi:hypothetical protein
LKSVAQSEEGKSIVKRGKTVCIVISLSDQLIVYVVEKAINQPEVRGMLMSGGKLLDEMKTNEKLRELLQSNVR